MIHNYVRATTHAQSRHRKWTSDDCRAVVLIEALQLDSDCASLLRHLHRSHGLCVSIPRLWGPCWGIVGKLYGHGFWLCISSCSFLTTSQQGINTQSPWLLRRGLKSDVQLDLVAVLLLLDSHHWFTFGAMHMTVHLHIVDCGLLITLVQRGLLIVDCRLWIVDCR